MSVQEPAGQERIHSGDTLKQTRGNKRNKARMETEKTTEEGTGRTGERHGEKKTEGTRKGGKGKSGIRLSASFMTGTIALVFLVVGYQVALFLNRAAVSKVLADRSSPDTVYIAVAPDMNDITEYEGTARSGKAGTGNIRITSNAKGYRIDQQTGERIFRGDRYGKAGKRKSVENFRFNPNTVTAEELERLGFSEKQALAIVNYRKKGGRFNRKSDFAKSFVVADSVYRRLEPYIDIPSVDLNRADSAALDALPGIGGYFAQKIIEHRERLGGYSYKEQLMDIYRFDREKYGGLEDMISVSTDGIRPYPLWRLPEDSLRLHPYIGSYAAHGIVLYRENNPVAQWTIDGLDEAGILREGMADKLSKCHIEPPEVLHHH